MEVLCILGVAGSLRRGSYNRALLRAAQELLPEGMTLELFDLRDIPPYDMDVEQQGLPTPVVAWKEAIRRADALLIATPEHNWSVPGVLKNAIDWASRPPGDNVFQGKPVAIMGASTGLYGTVRAQLHLRQVLASVDAYVLNRPQVLVARAQDKFDAEGQLIDEPTRALVRNLLTALRDWTLRLRKPSPRDG
jgi:chromate reductase